MIQLIFTGYILLVIFLSLIPTAALGIGTHSDKLAHFIAYGVMGVLAYLFVESKQKRAYLFIFVISLGAVLEFFQFYIPGRSTSFFDIIANTVRSMYRIPCCLVSYIWNIAQIESKQRIFV